MNICIFTKFLPAHIVGGAEIHTQELAEGLIKKGHKVTIITSRHPKKIAEENRGDLKIYYTNCRLTRFREKFYKESYKLFKKLNDKEYFDLIHSQGSLGCGCVKYGKINIPLIMTLQGTALKEIVSIFKTGLTIKGFLMIFMWLKILLFDELIFFKKINKIIAVSDEVADDVEKWYRIPRGKIVVISNGADINNFKLKTVNDLKEKLKISNDKIILSAGNIVKAKGFHLLIKALPEILKTIKVKLLIVGQGEYLKELKKLTVSLGLENNVIFTGVIFNCDLPDYYNLADVFVLPSLKVEGLPLVIAEVMACQKPIIASKTGGVATAIKHYKNGILVNPKNLKELKEKILEVLNDEKLAATIGKEARKDAVEKFDLNKIIEKNISIYNEELRK